MMKKTLTALALTLVAGSMLACGGETPTTNNANNANKPATNTAPPMANTNSGAPMGNSNAPSTMNTNSPSTMNKNEPNKNEMKKEEPKNEKKEETKKP
jgi:hypothetical protein